MRRREVLAAGAFAVFGPAGFGVAGCGFGESGQSPDGPEGTAAPGTGDRTAAPPTLSPSDRPGSPAPSPGATTPGPQDPRIPQSTPRTTPGKARSPARTPAAALRFPAARAYRHVVELAGRIGPREATSPEYRAAASYVERRIRRAGLRVRRQALTVPEGVSWGVPVPAGPTFNLVAYAPGLDLTAPHLVVGAHLDTVPQAPGAEDNASGVAVLLELARLTGRSEPRLPVVFVAFGAEEPRGEGDDRHHYGSKAYLEALRPRERRAIGQMVSLDRVGVGPPVRIRTAGVSSRQAGPAEPIGDAVENRLASAARRIGVAVETGDINRASDHWPFHLAGIPAARVGGNPFAAYHSERDRPGVVSRAPLGRTGRLLWAWLAASAPFSR